MNTFENLKRLWSWIPVIWNDREFDYTYLLQIMEFKMRQMAVHHRTRQVVADWERTAKQLEEAAALCKRMGTDAYFDLTDYRHLEPHETNKKEDEMYARDMDRLFLLFKKYLRTWWD